MSQKHSGIARMLVYVCVGVRCHTHLECQEGNERISHTEMREMGSNIGKIMGLTEEYVQWSVLTSMMLKVWVLLSEIGSQLSVYCTHKSGSCL